MRSQGIAGPKTLSASAKALAGAWHALPAGQKVRFESLSSADRHRAELQTLYKEARLPNASLKVAAAARSAVSVLGRVPANCHVLASGPIGGLVMAIEDLDKRMSVQVRAAVGATLVPSLGSPAASASMRRTLGEQLGARLAAVLRRWVEARSKQPASQSVSKVGSRPLSEPPSRKRPAPAAAKQSAVNAEVDDTIRDRVVGLLMRTFSRCVSKASFSKAKEVEASIYEVAHDSAKDYKQRARTIVFNLSAGDGVLLNKVLEGQLLPSELVKMGVDELAPEAVREERRKERERYFRTEVHDVVGPPKRRKELYAPRGHALKEDEESQAPALSSQPGCTHENLEDIGCNEYNNDACPGQAEQAWSPNWDITLDDLEDALAAPMPDAGEGLEEAGQCEESESESTDDESSSSVSAVRAQQAGLGCESSSGQTGPTLASSAFRRAPGATNQHGEVFASDVAHDETLAKCLQEMDDTSSSSTSSSSRSPSPQPEHIPSNAASLADPSAHFERGTSSHEPMPEAVNRDVGQRAQLTAMGFQDKAVDVALRRARGNLQKAASFLCRQSA